MVRNIQSDIQSLSFKSVINYAYGNDPEITASNVLSVRYICDKYQMKSLGSLCESYFSKFLKSENLCYLLNGAVLIKSNQFIQTCQDAIELFANEADKIIKSNGFLQLSLNAMILFLQSDVINIKEEQLWEYTIKWAQYQYEISNHSKNENDYDIKSDSNNMKLYLLKNIRKYIRFGLMNGAYIVKNVKPLNCLTDSELVSIFSYIHCPNDEILGHLFRTIRRGIRKQFRIFRGNVGNSCDWTYGGGNDVDAICIKSNKSFQLIGIGIFDCGGTVQTKCKIYKGDNDNKENIIAQSDEEIFIRHKASKEPMECKIYN